MRLFFVLFLIVWFPLHGVSLARASLANHGSNHAQANDAFPASTQADHDHSHHHGWGAQNPDRDPAPGDGGAHSAACYHLSFANYLFSEIVVPINDNGLGKFPSPASTLHTRFVSVPERIPVARA